ncbi:serine protease FAM111B-like isoform X2 [Heterodontus francisci]|uniref:serine protease FAM111B-like isoform X2 n=1 Tax=Heterodontus francisci TaxID=7792 RepID=UPI00355C23BB
MKVYGDIYIRLENNGNEPPTPVLHKRSHAGYREPLSQRNGSNDTGKKPETSVGKTPEHSEEDRVKEFTYSFQRNSKEYVARGKPDESILSVLRSSEAFKEEQGKNEGKTFHLIGKREIRGAVNLGMPCKCLPKEAHFEVIFYRDNGEIYYRDEDSSGKECVLFHIRSTGKSAGKLGTGPKPIIKSASLRADGYDLCIYAFVGETIREALCRDGRFLPVIENHMWNLMEEQRSLQFTLAVNDLHNKHFEVKVSNKKYKAGNKANGASPKESQEVRNVAGEGNKLLQDLTKQVDESLGKTRSIKEQRKQWNLFKKEFGKITSDGVPIKIHEMLVQSSGSVGFVRWNNNGNQGTASCFHLGDGYIMTCYHVVKMIVGDWVRENHWGAIIEESTQIIFTYKDILSTSGWYHVKPWIQVYCSELDYALLKLKNSDDQGSDLPPRVSLGVSKPPKNGVVYVIGHPEGVCKSTDTCIIIPFEQREIKVLTHGHRWQVLTKYSFREITSTDRITYDSCFFHGASGSPVFDSSGKLVGMHAGGYEYDNGYVKNSVIEYGPTIAAIAGHMKKHHSEYDILLLNGHNQAQDEQNMAFDDQEEAPMDTE